LDHASVIAFDPGRPSIYAFSLGMPLDEFRQQVLNPMGKSGLFAVGQTQFIDASKRDRYRGQLPRIGLTLFEVAGYQCGIVLSYHTKFQPDLAQYMAWQNFWHQQLLETARVKARP
jgi:hypothetical protein